DMVRGKPTISQVTPILEDFLGDAVLIAHNAAFDRGFLENFLKRQHTWLDTLEIARILLPCESGYSLDNLTKILKIKNPDAHRAAADARATAQLFLYLVNLLEETDAFLLEILFKLSTDQNDGVNRFFEEAYSRRVKSFSKERLSARNLFVLGAEQYTGLFRNTSGHKDNNYRIPSKEIENMFQEGGTFAQNFPDYEYRPQQLEMAQSVARSFNENQNLIVEAGTGTGKSLAYLLPAVIWSLKSGQKVVASTHTINLQEQLLNKDIPLVKTILGVDFSAVEIKGRSHYLCIRKWEYWFTQDNPEIKRFMMRLVLWLSRTESGDSNEMSLSAKESGSWQWLAARGDTCFGIKCPYFRGACFVSRVKRRAEAAHVLIINHSLLLANAIMDENILPEYKYLIIDEAHHLEKVAEDQFGTESSYYQLSLLLSRLKKKERSANGVLDNIAVKVNKSVFSDDNFKNKITKSMVSAGKSVNKCYVELREFFRLVAEFFSPQASSVRKNLSTVRIMSGHRLASGWDAIISAGENLVFQLKELAGCLTEISEQLSYLEAESGWEVSGSGEINIIIGSLREQAVCLENILTGDEENLVCWVEFTGDGHYPMLHTAPVQVNQLLHKSLFAVKSSVVMTSATLTINNQFNYFKDSIGINLGDRVVETLVLASPFLYRENVLIGSVSDLPDPSKASELVFTEAISQALIKIVQASQGRTLVLFTSHMQLRQVYTRIRTPLEREGITVLAHGLTGSRAKLLEQFKSNPSSVILGANSFWEGVDVVGHTLSSVIIVKLPFWPPVLPTVSARLERYRKMNRDGFYQYSLPQAIIRFKQGFGRLIRSGTDYGVGCILDKRIYEKRYGQLFIRSLPGVKMEIKKTEEMAETIEKWLRDKNTCLGNNLFPSCK
ncbi:MAG: helicase C-terminal domain-containing protein, partial [Desulfitobacteriaceae bacterium]|nr:helicase C-terminal domain-containing protein [Desulfitobacteriaceae bacterium]